jgi:ABC-type phosphate/phosphonate transport system substrate-binding protein
MTLPRRIAYTFVLAAMVPAAAYAASTDFVVESSGSGGTAETAGPYLQQFTDYADKVLKKKVAATFYADRKSLEAALPSKQPGFGMLDIEEFLELHKSQDLTVIASVEGEMHDRGHLHVVVKDPAIKSLDDLKGKTVDTSHGQSTTFLSKVVFDGKIDVTTFFQLKVNTSALKGLKDVDRGESAAAIVDDATLAKMKSLPFGSSMRTIFTSAALPPSPFVAFGKNTQPSDRTAVQKMLWGMCGDKKGAEVCKSYQVTKFAKPDLNAFNEAIRRFEK